MGQVQPQRRRHLTPAQRFSLLLLTTLLVGSVGLSGTAAWLIQRTVLGQTWQETLHGVDAHVTGLFGSDVFVQPAAAAEHAAHAPASSDFGDYGSYGDYGSATGQRATAPAFDYQRFDRLVRFHFAVYDIVHTRFVRADGRIVYSYQPDEVGRPIAGLIDDERLARALAGEVVTELAVLPAGGAPDGSTGAEAASIFVPVTREGRLVGVVWVQRDVTRLLAAIRQAQLVLVGVTLGVVGLLYLALRRVFADSTTIIRSQAGALASALADLSATYDATLRSLVAALDSRDSETGGHAQRVTRLALRLGQELGLSDDELVDLERAALLHDIGKIAVPDAILRKPGPLTEAEWVVMRQHPAFGAAIVAEVPFLSGVMPLVRHHHEWWDGQGYPDGLAGEAIPLGARIFALADAFDAMTSRRPYRQPCTLEQVRAELRRCAGSQFDPAVVAASEGVSDVELLSLMEVPILGETVPGEAAA